MAQILDMSYAVGTVDETEREQTDLAIFQRRINGEVLLVSRLLSPDSISRAPEPTPPKITQSGLTNRGLPLWRLWLRWVLRTKKYLRAEEADRKRDIEEMMRLEAEARRFEKEEHERQRRALEEFDKLLSAPEVADVTQENK